MNLKPIKTEQDYDAALQEIDRLWDVEPDTPESDTLEILVTLVEAYEKEHYEQAGALCVGLPPDRRTI